MRPIVSRVVVVCTANICRSPTAQAFLQQDCGQPVQVQSAGIIAMSGAPIDVLMAKRLRQTLGDSAGPFIDAHRARQLGYDLAVWAELVLVMTKGHQAWCSQQFPFLTGRVRLFADGNQDVEDPHQRSDVLYDSVFEQLGHYARNWAGRIKG